MKPNSKGSDAPVQGTNDNSIVSKCSMAAAGYFEDTFLQYFVAKKSRRSPLINRGYYIRARAIDFALNLFLTTKTSEKKQIISLGAGFDSSYFRLRDKGALLSTRFLEIDFPNVVQRKTKLIYATKDLVSLINENKSHSCGDFESEIISNGYSLIGCDLTDLNRLENAIDSVQFSKEYRTLFLSEVVLTYVNKDSCSKLIKWAAETFPNSVFLLYEQINPDDAFGFVMKKHFTTLQSPLRCIDSYPTLESQIERFRALGWKYCSAMDMNEFFYSFISKDERERISNIEAFDEFEEWHLKCAHYVLVGAFSGSCSSLEGTMFPVEKIGKRRRKEVDSPLLPWKCSSKTEETLKRFGHHIVPLGDNRVLISGGFGCSGNKHQRLRDGVVVDLSEDDEASHTIQSYALFDKSKLFHTVSKLSNGSIFVFGGRESPLKPCLDYGIFKIEELLRKHCTENDADETHLRKRALVFDWAAQLSTDASCVQERIEPCPRWRHSATRVFIRGKECVLIFGGRNSCNLALSDCWLFHVADHRWQKIDLQMDSDIIQPRHSHSACAWGDDRLIFTGGLNADSQPFRLCEILHLKDEEFRFEAVKLDEDLPARYSHTSHIIGDKMWLIGGVDVCSSSEILVIDLSDWKWKEYKLQARSNSSTFQPLMLHNHASFLGSDREIIIFGGGGNCFSFGTYFNAGIISIDV